MLTVQGVGPRIEARLTADRPSPDSRVLARVDEIWRDEARRRGEVLFNGAILSVASFDAETVVAWTGEYRWFLAQRREPELFDMLRMRPLAVSGVLSCEGGVVFGQRTQFVEMDAGLWELVPSGGVPPPDDVAGVELACQLLTELEEEVLIDRRFVLDAPKALALVEDDESHVIDVAFAMHVGLSASAIIAAFEAQSTKREYASLEIVPNADLRRYRQFRGASLSELSHLLLEASGS